MVVAGGEGARRQGRHQDPRYVPNRVQAPGLELSTAAVHGVEESPQPELEELLDHVQDGRRHQPLTAAPRGEEVRGPLEPSVDELSLHDHGVELLRRLHVEEARAVEDRGEGRRGQPREGSRRTEHPGGPVQDAPDPIAGPRVPAVQEPGALLQHPLGACGRQAHLLHELT